jgi:hypothetical protein
MESQGISLVVLLPKKFAQRHKGAEDTAEEKKDMRSEICSLNVMIRITKRDDTNKFDTTIPHSSLRARGEPSPCGLGWKFAV